jgi:mannopine transport system permease protein
VDRYLAFPPRALTLDWYLAFFNSRDWTDAAVFSLRIAALTAVFATIIGTMASLALVRGRIAGKSLLNAVIIAPLIVPTIILAVGLYSIYARLGFLGSLPAFVLAHSAMTAPYVVLTVSAALYRFDWNLEMAAQSLGASRLTTFRRVTLPTIRPAVLAGAALAFINSFDEAVVAFFISGVTQKTITRKLWEDIEFGITPTIAAVGTMMTVLSLLLIGIAEIRRVRRLQVTTAESST